MTLCYDPPRRPCAGRVQPGTVSLRVFCMSHFAECENAGDYVCRLVVGSTLPSVHGDGRAWDAHFDQPGPGRRNPLGDILANWLVAHAEEIGVQVVIWNRLIWSGTRPYWRTYTGPNPHIDHVHVELCRRSATELPLTLADLEAIWAGTPAPPDPTIPDDDQEDLTMYRIIGADGVPALYEADEAITIKSGIPDEKAYEELKQGKAFGGHFRMGRAELEAVPLRHTGQPGL